MCYAGEGEKDDVMHLFIITITIKVQLFDTLIVM